MFGDFVKMISSFLFSNTAKTAIKYIYALLQNNSQCVVLGVKQSEVLLIILHINTNVFNTDLLLNVKQ